MSVGKQMTKRLKHFKKINLNDFQIYIHKSIVRQRSQSKYKLDNKECEMCGSKINLTRHHEEYNAPRKFIVLCRECHNKVHEKGEQHD